MYEWKEALSKVSKIIKGKKSVIGLERSSSISIIDLNIVAEMTRMLHDKQGEDTAKSFKSQVKKIHQKVEYTHGATQRWKKSNFKIANPR